MLFEGEDSPVVVIQLAGVVPVEGGGGQRVQLLLLLLVSLLQVHDDRVQELDLCTRTRAPSTNTKRPIQCLP